MKSTVNENLGILLRQIYCDNHLLILEKPAGISTQPEFHEQAKAWGKQAFNKPGNIFLEPIHRLDRPVGGMVVFARTSKALSRLNESMRKGEIQKFYIALVEGEIGEEGTLEHHLLHGDHRALIAEPGEGRLARLSFVRKKVKGGKSLVQVELHTGRYHQIRAQFSAAGHPIVGDKKYGAKKESKAIALHHNKLILPHPVSKKRLTFQSQAASFF